MIVRKMCVCGKISCVAYDTQYHTHASLWPAHIKRTDGGRCVTQPDNTILITIIIVILMSAAAAL